jgi:hypothetical protein
VRAKFDEHLVCIVIGITSAEANQVDISIAVRELYFSGYVMCTFHKIYDDNSISNAFATIRTKKSIITNHGHSYAPLVKQCLLVEYELKDSHFSCCEDEHVPRE